MRILGYRTSNEEAVTIADRDWGQHLYCVGASGAGKSTFLEGLMARDLADGRGFCFIDKHGDSANRIADSSPQSIIYWRPADLAFPIGHIPFRASRRTSGGA